MITLAEDIKRTHEEFVDLAHRLALLERHDPRVQGAWAAVEWLIGDTDVTPTGRTAPVTGNLLREAHHAAMITAGFLNGHPQFGAGSEAILFWALGTQPLPWWLKIIR